MGRKTGRARSPNGTLHATDETARTKGRVAGQSHSEHLDQSLHPAGHPSAGSTSCLAAPSNLSAPHQQKTNSVSPMNPQSLAAADRISAGDDLSDEYRYGLVHIFVAVLGCRLFVGQGSILQDSQNLMLGQEVAVIHGQEQGFADRQGGITGDIL